MLDIISMIVLLIISVFIGIMGILIIIGGNLNKSDEERKYEDEEQLKYIREYNEKHKRKNRFCLCFRKDRLYEKKKI